MERLTRRVDGGVVFPNELLGASLTPDNEYMHKILTRLAAYEDTGLQPEEIILVKNVIMGQEVAKITEFDGIPIQRLQDLAQAEKDGRLVVLPCKLNEPIFYIENGEWYDDTPYEVGLGQKAGEWNDSLAYECQYGFCFYAEDIGKTVFLTSDEAEVALKKREEADNEAD